MLERIGAISPYLEMSLVMNQWINLVGKVGHFYN